MKYSKSFIATKYGIKKLKKVEELILYILTHYNNDKLTQTKLHKILYYCDFDHYEKFKKPITEGTYMNNNYGPTLDELKLVLDSLERGGKVKRVLETNQFGEKQTRYLVTSDELVFNFEEPTLGIIKDVNERYKELKPTELSALSHFDAPYLISDYGEKLSYKNVLFRDDQFEVSDDERKAWQGFLTKDEKSKLLKLVQIQ